MMIAANAFANVNLGPKELAFGGDFRIAEWQGIGNAKCETPENVKNMQKTVCAKLKKHCGILP